MAVTQWVHRRWRVLGRAFTFTTTPMLLLAGLLPACEGASDAASRRPDAPPEAIPASVAVGPATVTVGFESGVIRATREVGSLRASRTPTTVDEYRLCVEAGACVPPSASSTGCQELAEGRLDGRTFEVPNGGRHPVTCCSTRQASAYCKWVGGRLPTEAEWLLLARGATPQRFSWGDRTPTCVQHPSGGTKSEDPCGGAGADGSVFDVGRHPEGASPTGAEDVLLAPTELIGPSDAAYFVGCRPPGGGCLVSGFVPGSIDVFFPIASSADSPEEAYSAHAFRCVWENQG
jgi:formylglycine-generating enzyme required for sulfatase activity